MNLYLAIFFLFRKKEKLCAMYIFVSLCGWLHMQLEMRCDYYFYSYSFAVLIFEDETIMMTTDVLQPAASATAAVLGVNSSKSIFSSSYVLNDSIAILWKLIKTG